MTDDTANAHDVVHKRPVLDHAPADAKMDEVLRFQQHCETRFAAARLEEVMRGDPPLRVRQIIDYTGRTSFTTPSSPPQSQTWH